jgi:hypothetical protein
MTTYSTILFSAAVIGLSLANPPNARADLCFQYGSGGGALVARDATLLKEGTCQPLALFESGSLVGAANGMICRDGPGAGGITLVFYYTYDACIGAPAATSSRQPAASSSTTMATSPRYQAFAVECSPEVQVLTRP